MHVPDMEVERAYTLFEEVITDHFGERMKTDDDLCSRIWSSLANVDWYYVKGEKPVTVGYSFRAAGSMIAGIRGFGDYMDWYCSGPDADVAPEFRLSDEDLERIKFMNEYFEPEGSVHWQIEEDLVKLGWNVLSERIDKDD